jgi:catechol 2,3-dioxygenase-like lactoylglutathione lyase family enzyme
MSNPAVIEHLSAVTLLTADMRRSVEFYRALGFELRHGGETAAFTTFAVGSGYLNLEGSAERPLSGWGRVIFHVADVDATYERAVAHGFRPSMPPSDAPWGERFFHILDPSGHELSFAKPLP